MSQTPERDQVDKALASAREAAQGLDTEKDRAKAMIQIYCTEALVRQVRDLDDDVWHLRGSIIEAQADAGIQLGGIQEAITDLAKVKKGGLF